MSAGRLAKRFLWVAAAVGLLAILACGSADDATPTPVPTATSLPALPTIASPVAGDTPTPMPPSGDQPQYGGTISKSETAVNIFDPNHSRAGYGLQLGMVGNLYSQLVRVPPDTRTGVEGDLAESWSVSGDGTEYTFKLRAGVVDHEGNALTADDIYWGMVRYVERPNGVSVRRQGCVRNYVKSIWDDSMNPEASPGAEVISSSEIVIRLEGPRAAFIPCMTGGFVMFHSEKYVKPIDTDASGETRDLDPSKGEINAEYGPFKFKNMEIDNFFSVERNDNYFKEGLPYLDGIDIFAMSDESARVAAFRSGRIDTSCTWVCFSKANVDALLSDFPDLQIPSLVTIGYRSYQINTRRAPLGPVGDPTADKLRTAINLAIDRDVVNKIAFDGIGFLSTPYYINWEWIRSVDEWRAQPGWAATADKGPEIAEARAIMEGLGYSATNKLKVSTLSQTAGQGLRENEALKAVLDEIYIDVTIDAVERGARTDRLEAFDFQIFSDSVGAPFVDPDAYHTNIFFPFERGSRNRSGYIPQAWLDLHDKQTVLASTAERAPILRQMADMTIKDAFMIGSVRPGLQQPNRGNWRDYMAPVLDGSNFSYEYLWLAP